MPMEHYENLLQETADITTDQALAAFLKGLPEVMRKAGDVGYGTVMDLANQLEKDHERIQQAIATDGPRGKPATLAGALAALGPEGPPAGHPGADVELPANEAPEPNEA